MRIIIAIVVLSFPLYTTDLTFAQTQADMTGEACQKFQKADVELNRVYQQILSANSRDANFTKAFREAQRAWLSFRDAHVKSIFPDPDPGAYGSVNPMCRCAVLEEITTLRKRQLRQRWILGFAEGDVCTGSGAVRRSGQ